MLSFHISKSIFILCPPSVEVFWPVASSLKHSPSPSIVHVAPDREGLPTPWVYGVHSRPSAAQDMGLLAVKGPGVQVGTADWMGMWEDGIEKGYDPVKVKLSCARCLVSKVWLVYNAPGFESI